MVKKYIAVIDGGSPLGNKADLQFEIRAGILGKGPLHADNLDESKTQDSSPRSNSKLSPIVERTRAAQKKEGGNFELNLHQIGDESLIRLSQNHLPIQSLTNEGITAMGDTSD